MDRQSPFVERATDVTLSIEDETGDVEHRTGMYTSKQGLGGVGSVEMYKVSLDHNIAVDPKTNYAYLFNTETRECELLGTVIGMRKGHEPHEKAVKYANGELYTRPITPQTPSVE